MSFSPFRAWFFDRLIWVLLNGEWTVKIKDFKNSKNKNERKLLGLTNFYPDKEGGIIYLDSRQGTARILIHELGHVVLGNILDDEARDKNCTEKEIDEWSECQAYIFERLFYQCLSVKQKRILQIFIDKAKIDFERNHQ